MPERPLRATPNGSPRPASCASATAASRCSSAAPDGRRLVRVRGDDAHPASQGLRLREALAARLLPERSAPADEAAAPAQRRHVRGDRLGHRDPRGRGALRGDPRHLRRRVDLLLRRRRAGEPPSRRVRPQHARGRSARSIARARSRRRRRASSGSRTRWWAATRAPTSSTARWRSSSARIPGSRTASRARASPCARSRRTRSRCLIVVDPAPHRDRRDRRHPSAGEAGHRRVAARGAGRRAGAGGPARPRLARRARRRPRRGAAALRASCPWRTTAPPAACRRSSCARPRGASRRRRAWPRSRTWACR